MVTVLDAEGSGSDGGGPPTLSPLRAKNPGEREEYQTPGKRYMTVRILPDAQLAATVRNNFLLCSAT